MKQPVPRDLPPHSYAHRDEKYRVHKVGALWYLCDTVQPGNAPWFKDMAQMERLRGWTRLYTLDGRQCKDIHLARQGFDTFEHAQAAYLSQVS